MARAKTAVYSNDQIINAATGHWGEVAHDVKPAEPYVIAIPGTDTTITVPVLTRGRRKKLKASQATYLMMGAQLAEVAREANPDQTSISRIQGLIDAAEKAYDEAVFGDAYDQVVEFFEDLPEEWWDAMYQAIHDKLINRVELPEDACPKCGRPLEDTEEGEAPKDKSSSTSSNVTSMKSRATSGTTSA